MQAHTLQYQTTIRTLAEWGIESCVVESELGLSGGRMTLTLQRAIDAADLWPAFATLTLRDPSGVVRFIGLSINPPRKASSEEEVRSYQIVGLGSYFEWTTYKQLASFATDVENPSSPTGARYVSRLILNRNSVTGAALTIKQQMELILEYVVSTRGAPIAYSSMHLPTINAPENEVLDLRANDAMEAELAWCPHIGARWDFSGLEPTLTFADVVDGSTWGTRVLRLAGGPENWEGVPRFDLLSPQVRIDYIGQAQAGTEPRVVKWLTLHSDISTVSNGAWGAEEMTIVLRGLVWDGETYTAGEPRPPDGLAASIHKAYSRLYYDMTWSTVGEEVDWAPQVGEQWIVDGAGAGFATAQAVCQRITRDIGAGRTSYACGAPAHLGLGERLDLLRANRLRGISVSAGEMTYGFAPPDADPTATGGETIRVEMGRQVTGGGHERIVVDIQGTIVP